MTMDDVEQLAAMKLRSQGQRTWGTHTVKQGTTDVWLQFDGGKLQSVQVATLNGLMSMKLWPRYSLCAKPVELISDPPL